MINKKIIGLFVLLLVAGCSSSNIQDEWECPINQGTGCKTISEADGDNGGDSSAVGKFAKIKPAADQPDRKGEVIGKIYFYPFVDVDGNYHKGTTIFKVFEPAEWK